MPLHSDNFTPQDLSRQVYK